MAYLWLKCDECEEEVEVYCDGDNAMICPECRSIDCFSDIDDEEQAIDITTIKEV